MRSSIMVLVLVGACTGGGHIEPLICGQPSSLLHSPDFADLAGCTTFRGSIQVGDDQDIASLTEYPELATLEVVEGFFVVFRNPNLTNLDGIRLTAVGRLDITSNPILDDLDGLARIRSITGDVLIASNNVLADLSGLARLETVGGALQISSNPALASLDGFAALAMVDGDLVITENQALPQSAAEAFAAGLAVGGVIDISDNKPRR